MLGNEPGVSPGTRGARDDHHLDGDPLPDLCREVYGLECSVSCTLVLIPPTVLPRRHLEMTCAHCSATATQSATTHQSDTE